MNKTVQRSVRDMTGFVHLEGRKEFQSQKVYFDIPVSITLGLSTDPSNTTIEASDPLNSIPQTILKANDFISMVSGQDFVRAFKELF